MQNTIEIKAMTKEAAVLRALNILDASSEDLVQVVEKQKSKSFLGLFNKEGIYEITIDKNRKVENYKKEDIKKEKSIKEEKLIKERSKLTTEDNLSKEKKLKETYNEKIDIKKETQELKKDFSEDTQKLKKDKITLILEKTKTLLSNMNLDLKCDVTTKDGKYYVVNLYGNDNGIIIGKKGKTLNSFEYLLNSMIKECRIDVDVEGFKEKRNDTLRELARKMAEKAINTNKVIRLNSMPPKERKIIHEIINQYPELDTFSEGKDPKRYIVIRRKKLGE
ncbi:MAG: protein jag [Fusobacteriaceae bacterium]